MNKNGSIELNSFANASAVQSNYNIFTPLKNNRYLVYNSLKASFALWDKDDMSLYKKAKKRNYSVHDNQIKEMVYGGYLTSSAVSEMELLQNKYNATRKGSRSMTMTVAPTLGCNFACDYCFQGLDKAFATMDDEIQNAIVETVKHISPKLHSIQMAWYGGEPLIERKLIYKMSERIIEVCKETQTGYTAFVVTNGWFLNVEVAKRLEELFVKRIQVTLDGPALFHDEQRYLLSRKPTFHRIIENLQNIVNNDINIFFDIRVNIDTRNQDHIIALIDTMEEYGLSGKNLGMYFAPVEGITEGCHDASATSMSKKKYGILEADLYRYAFEKKLTSLPYPPNFFGLCTATNPKSVVVVPNGDLHKCWDTVSWPSMAVGNIKDYDSIFSDDRYIKWNSWSPFDDPICNNCKILPNCAGACAYKFVHNDKLRGEAAALPCPSWKYNINERLFLRAEKLGMVKKEDWDDSISVTNLETRDHQYDKKTRTSKLQTQILAPA